MIEKPPAWKKSFSSDLFQKALQSESLQNLIKKADKEYAYWSKFKHYPVTDEFNINEAWAFLKFTRFSNREVTLIKTERGESFSFTTTKTMYQRLSYIDSNTSGFIRSAWAKPTELQKNQLIISSLSEEAIASSQIEGANTSRKIAKEMILTQRKPRTRSEQMIINNYQVMQRLLEWKDLDLSIDILLELQQNITSNTLDDANDSGRLRDSSDDENNPIKVVDSLTGETVYDPPKSELVKIELESLIRYANTEENEENFIHPVIKASILHFWLAYLHPFVDGNGRTARALFYWYLLKRNYWMFQYLSVSRVIRSSKKRYDNAYLYSEIDDNDLTYFLQYKLKVIIQAIEDFASHYKKKMEKEKRIKGFSSLLSKMNERQIEALYYLHTHPQKTIDISSHKARHLIAYQTARTDLIKLAEKGYISQMVNGKKYEYVPNVNVIKNLFSTNESKIS
ncbi:MAG: hypothetical protein CEO22_449 [Candidatus Berkelbacteria bacterium Gr01-1014_85]|uniref:Fido domain-containing protein n=1 Tax=Candidatus Berkelbacteria bacterium Gr01-1014_85 TaxID=2017150 RepID=A0A554JAX0_9BACT|nr:MAG: hypothetical protein CEO22_449 [Candidatus Berkelbacteria bacterium Gr01-1014_85]